MAEAIARARFLRISPRKMRLVADMIRGKKVSEARVLLDYTVKGASPLLRKVLDAAVANAESKAAETRQRLNTDDMVISTLLVDGGFSMKRIVPGPRGRRMLIRKRTSHVHLVITDEKR
ncbi:MAG TPA: 50S ribosomal protein L22 [Candidatus Hydrogenedentes bacterium]|jgi:large subunit ribosomal protein L22|nr:50S ribosomal protein L22 [Candidatus Hydrogenedentota bacterium]HOL77741.1 50S ribosomal protein L22 [Candidatus Hydrogenedentota bacterium]HPO86445.1 50S ribosomal protein L22 [Candidatus Hydrogenedentota bacterium]